MNPVISAAQSFSDKDNIIILSNRDNYEWKSEFLSEHEVEYVKQAAESETTRITLLQSNRVVVVQFLKKDEDIDKEREYSRKDGCDVLETLRRYRIEELIVLDKTERSLMLSYAEGMALGAYQFLKYYIDADKRKHSLKNIGVYGATEKEAEELNIVTEATCIARNLVNEPLSYLTAPKLSEEYAEMSKKSGFTLEVFDKKKITALKMGGLLAVNRGSFDPPTFNIMEWKPDNAKNKRPIVLVGKGIVFDTGGVSLKPTSHSMDFMKSDMGGAAAVGGAMYAIAKAKLPVHVIALVPATDNRPGREAYVPGDVITMHSGATVEVLNTDAEGRMVMADALHFAKKYDPELVLDFATLTGAAARSIGGQGIVYMGTADDETKNKMKKSGYNVQERLVEFPLWEEYKELIKSDIADIKNIGGPTAGAITAGLFLKHFTDYPWLHFDIAGAAFLHTPDSYRGKNGTGVGVRLLFDFISNY